MGADVTGYALKGPTDPCLFDVAGLEDHMDSVEGDVRDLAHLKEGIWNGSGRRWCFTWRHSRLCGIPIKIGPITYETNVMETVNVLECVPPDPSPVRSFYKRDHG